VVKAKATGKETSLKDVWEEVKIAQNEILKNCGELQGLSPYGNALLLQRTMFFC
jgi:hypothetical protein